MNFGLSKKAIIIFIGLTLVLAAGCREQTPMQAGEERYFVPKDPPDARYTIEATGRLSEAGIAIEATETIVFRNPAARPMHEFALEGFFAIKDFHILAMDRDLTQPDRGEPERGIKFFSLPEPLAPGGEITVNIDYKLEIPVRQDRPISLQAWYPKLWWDGLPTRDAFRVKWDGPEGYALATSGRLDPATGYLENPGVATRFGIWMAKGLEVEERDAGGVLVRALFTEKGAECARLCLETAVDVIRFYQDVHGLFPFRSLTIIPGGAKPWGGYPFASALVVIHGQEAFGEAPELHWKWITAHEAGHQYWGEYVLSGDTPGNYTESWVMIGMGIFCDRMWVESRGLPNDKHQAFFNRYLSGVKSYFDVTADAPESLKAKQEYDRNNILIHGKGYSIVSALRETLGDEVFRRVYLRCVGEYVGRRLGYRDFWRIAEEESGENLGWFFEQWVRSPRYLCYGIASKECRPEGDGYVSEIVVERIGDSITMPVAVQAVFEDGTEQTVRTDRFLKRTHLRFRSRAALKNAVLDPRKRLAMLDEPLPVLPDELPARVRKLDYNGEWEEGLGLFKTALEAGAKDASIWFKLGMVIFEGGYLNESFSCFEKVLDSTSDADGQFMALTWMGNVRDAQGRRDEAVKYYREALGRYAGSDTRHDQFGIQSSRTWIEDRLKAPYDWTKIIKR